MYFWTDHTRRIVFGWSMKCGCTHVKYLFHYLVSNGQDTDKQSVHTAKNIGRGGSASALIECLPSRIENYTVFLFVRNPFKRLVSGFLDKYRPSEHGNSFADARWKHPTLTFSLFVNELEKREWKMVEQGHFEEQTASHFKPEIFRAKELHCYDIEHIDYSQIETAFGTTIPAEVRNYRGDHTRDISVKSPASASTSISASTIVADWELSTYFKQKVPVASFYTPDLKRRVREFYNADFYFAKLLGIDYDNARL